LDVTRWPTTSYEEIARLPDDAQNEILEELKEDFEAASMTTHQLHNWIDRKFLFNLDKVSWDLSEDKIAGKIACNKCPMRANCQESLFDDLEGDNKCLNKECFEEKAASVKKIIADAAKEKHGIDVKLIDEETTYGSQDGLYMGRYEINKCRKSDPGAKRAVFVSGKSAGKPTWVNEGGVATGSGSKKTGPIDDTIRLERVEKKRAKYLTEKMVAMLKETKMHPAIDTLDVQVALTSFIAVFGISTDADTRVSWFDEGAWSHAFIRSEEDMSKSVPWCTIFETVETEPARLLDTIWNQVRMVMIDHFEYLLKYTPSLREVEFCLGLMKMADCYDPWYEEAVNEVNMPKSLAKTYDKYGLRLGGID